MQTKFLPLRGVFFTSTASSSFSALPRLRGRNNLPRPCIHLPLLFRAYYRPRGGAGRSSWVARRHKTEPAKPRFGRRHLHSSKLQAAMAAPEESRSSLPEVKGRSPRPGPGPSTNHRNILGRDSWLVPRFEGAITQIEGWQVLHYPEATVALRALTSLVVGAYAAAEGIIDVETNWRPSR